MVEEVESPGSMALSVESCVWSRVCGGLIGGDGETSSLGLVGEGEEVLVGVVVVVVLGEVLVAVTVVVQVRGVLALLVMEAGGL